MSGEVDELGKRLAQRRCRIIARGVGPQRDVGAEERRRICREKSGNSAGHCRPCRKRIHDARPRRRDAPECVAFDAPPKFAEAVEPMLDGVAGDDGGVDRPDGGADDPVGLDLRFVQGFVDAALVRSERAAALQHEDDLAVRLFAYHVDRIKRRPIPRHDPLLAFLCARPTLSMRLQAGSVHNGRRETRSEMPIAYGVHASALSPAAGCDARARPATGAQRSSATNDRNAAKSSSRSMRRR